MSAASESTFDPTESVRVLTETSFSERNMSLREHQETDKHYIGDALPVAADDSVAPIYLNNFVGESPFPARADHAHAFRGVYGSYASSGVKYFPPGRTFWNNLTYTGYGRNMLASSQIIAFPFVGIWRITASFLVDRGTVPGGTFKNEANVGFFYNNGAYAKTVWRTSMFDVPQVHIFDCWDEIVIGSVPNNVQFAMEQNDDAVWGCQNQGIIVSLISSWETI